MSICPVLLACAVALLTGVAFDVGQVGPPFLSIYFALSFMLGVLVLIVDELAKLRESVGDAAPPNLYRTAYLAGGERWATGVAVLTLLDAGALLLRGQGSLSSARAAARRGDAFERAVLRSAGAGATLEQIWSSKPVLAACEAFRRELGEAGLLRGRTDRLRLLRNTVTTTGCLLLLALAHVVLRPWALDVAGGELAWADVANLGKILLLTHVPLLVFCGRRLLRRDRLTRRGCLFLSQQEQPTESASGEPAVPGLASGVKAAAQLPELRRTLALARRPFRHENRGEQGSRCEVCGAVL